MSNQVAILSDIIRRKDDEINDLRTRLSNEHNYIMRLRNAGDELVEWVGCDEFPDRVIDEWNSAKDSHP